MSNNFIIAYTTIDNFEKSKQITVQLLQEKLIACANIIPNVTSIYEWNNQIEINNEYIMLFKTQENCYSKLQARILEMHPYDTPCVIKFKIADIEKNFGKWLANSINMR
ncbi:divalent-cation tolerance protein CutA [Rickettsiales endosymbiont of Stachyamoeba lipophora]|uniref:divalent-cation tolerance protein CutA n=1 Tax=Rickettsiales endosymbiont of Stachyamoeba lipophora TaxID=2486578 RepID=UPI000F653018|nr:divalent-cation tolerance protein CutA [Rickettsiales endosymbiont of Stachyamoeba lipophora]AZL15048.1 divalent-cation tolerance protein CutA [Rickettsiales endosymbiont of Stachyamoeba lipophora]